VKSLKEETEQSKKTQDHRPARNNKRKKTVQSEVKRGSLIKRKKYFKKRPAMKGGIERIDCAGKRDYRGGE